MPEVLLSWLCVTQTRFHPRNTLTGLCLLCWTKKFKGSSWPLIFLVNLLTPPSHQGRLVCFWGTKITIKEIGIIIPITEIKKQSSRKEIRARRTKLSKSWASLPSAVGVWGAGASKEGSDFWPLSLEHFSGLCQTCLCTHSFLSFFF